MSDMAHDKQASGPAHEMDDALDAEIQAALGDMSVEDMLDYADRPAPARGEREYKTGTVVNIHADDVFVEFGPKSQGICPLSQFTEKPAPGDRLDFVVDRFDKNDGLLILSRQGVVQKANWDALDVGQVVEARCTGTNKGGLDMEIASHKAFMPAGHVDLRHIPDLSIFVGEKMTCEVIELDRKRTRIVLSRKLPMEAERKVRREELLSKLEVGATMGAVITTIKPFGAFADLGGVDGLIHISDLSYERVSDPGQVVKEGDEVHVKILKIEQGDDGRQRIALGMKQMLEDPFASSMAALEIGGTVSGRITRIAQFGAFVEIGPGVEGLIHISELAHERVNRVSSVVKPDEVVTVKILSIDAGQRRIGLSLKATKEAEGGGERNEDPHMRKLRAQLSTKFGDNLKGGLG